MASPYQPIYATVGGQQPQPYGLPQKPPQPYTLQNNAQQDPQLQEFLNSWKARLGSLQMDEGKMRAEHDARTKQMIGQAQGDISDRASGANAALSEDLARRGIAGSGVEGGLRGGVSEAAQREQARAATNIALDQNKNYEAQRFAREQSVNSFLQGGLAAAAAPGQRMLDQQQLGLQQYQVMNNQGDKDLQNFVNYYKKPVKKNPLSGASNALRPRLG